VDPEGEGLMSTTPSPTPTGQAAGATPILEARGLVKRYGHVTALAGADFELLPGEILAVIGDNGAGKSSLIKCLSGAVIPDAGEIRLEGRPIQMRTPIDARGYGIETVYQTLAVSPSLGIADNLFLGREPRAPGVMGKVFRKLDHGKMRSEAKQQMTELGIMTIQDITQQVESLSGGQRQGVAVARAAAFGSKVIILDEPTAALGVKESAHVLELILKVRDSGIPVILISHNMPHVFEVADRIHIHRLGRRIAVVTPKTHTMNEVVAIMTGAAEPGAVGYDQVIKDAERAEKGHAAKALESAKDA
jgi:fructose transport system ATP-binding protein